MTVQTPEPTMGKKPPVEQAVDWLREVDREVQATGAFGSIEVKLSYQDGKPIGRPDTTIGRTL